MSQTLGVLSFLILLPVAYGGPFPSVTFCCKLLLHKHGLLGILVRLDCGIIPPKWFYSFVYQMAVITILETIFMLIHLLSDSHTTWLIQIPHGTDLGFWLLRGIISSRGPVNKKPLCCPYGSG